MVFPLDFYPLEQLFQEERGKRYIFTMVSSSLFSVWFRYLSLEAMATNLSSGREIVKPPMG